MCFFFVILDDEFVRLLVYAGIKLIDHVSKQKENGKTQGNLYIDLSKAFDTLTFDIFMFKLKYYGVTDTALEKQLPKKSKAVCCLL